MENAEIKICPICGEVLTKIVDGSSLVFECPKCKYGEATTIAQGIEWDDTEYTLSVPASRPELDQIKAVAKITGLNWIKSKALLAEGGVVFKGRAEHVKKIACSLRGCSIQPIIVPAFPYEVD